LNVLGETDILGLEPALTLRLTGIFFELFAWSLLFTTMLSLKEPLAKFFALIFTETFCVNPGETIPDVGATDQKLEDAAPVE
jgi:hypothetical protein